MAPSARARRAIVRSSSGTPYGGASGSAIGSCTGSRTGSSSGSDERAMSAGSGGTSHAVGSAQALSSAGGASSSAMSFPGCASSVWAASVSGSRGRIRSGPRTIRRPRPTAARVASAMITRAIGSRMKTFRRPTRGRPQRSAYSRFHASRRAIPLETVRPSARSRIPPAKRNQVAARAAATPSATATAMTPYPMILIASALDGRTGGFVVPGSISWRGAYVDLKGKRARALSRVALTTPLRRAARAGPSSSARTSTSVTPGSSSAVASAWSTGPSRRT